jgi:methionine-rich copper-binding protein CopC
LHQRNGSGRLQYIQMIARRHFLIGAVAAGFDFAYEAKAAEPARVLETMPANGAKIEAIATDYYVRFNQPVDHIHSVLIIKQNGSVVHTLQPRFKTEPEVLFARAPALAAGEYSFHWVVKTLSGVEMIEGENAFSVVAP